MFLLKAQLEFYLIVVYTHQIFNKDVQLDTSSIDNFCDLKLQLVSEMVLFHFEASWFHANACKTWFERRSSPGASWLKAIRSANTYCLPKLSANSVPVPLGVSWKSATAKRYRLNAVVHDREVTGTYESSLYKCKVFGKQWLPFLSHPCSSDLVLRGGKGGSHVK